MLTLRKSTGPRLCRPWLARVLPQLFLCRLSRSGAHGLRQPARDQRGPHRARHRLRHPRPPRHGNHQLRAAGRPGAQGQHGQRRGHPAGRRAAHERGQAACSTASSTTPRTRPRTSCRSGSSPMCTGIAPGYEQKTSMRTKSAAGCGWWPPPTAPGFGQLHADACLYAGLFDGAERAELALDPRRKGYVHLVRGALEVNGQGLTAGDAAKLQDETESNWRRAAMPRCWCSISLPDRARPIFSLSTNSGALLHGTHPPPFPTHDLAALLGRILIASLFVPFGFSKIGAFAGTVGYIGSVGLPLPQVGAALAIVIELGVGLLFLVGYKTRWSALVLALFTIAAAVLFHNTAAAMVNSATPARSSASCSRPGATGRRPVRSRWQAPTCGPVRAAQPSRYSPPFRQRRRSC